MPDNLASGLADFRLVWRWSGGRWVVADQLGRHVCLAVLPLGRSTHPAGRVGEGPPWGPSVGLSLTHRFFAGAGLKTRSLRRGWMARPSIVQGVKMQPGVQSLP